MAKKVNPKEQTKKISAAKWEFLKRNPESKRKYEESAATVSFRDMYPDIRKLINDIRCDSELSDRIKTLPDCDEFLKTTQCSPAVRAEVGIRQAYYNAWLNIPQGQYPGDDEMNLLWKEQILKDSKPILRELIGGQIDKTLLVSIDLTRTKKVIMGELEAILNKKMAGKKNDSRLKWLSMVDELLTTS